MSGSLYSGAATILPSSAFGKAQKRRTGNPLKLPAGVCDPQVRVYDDILWLYATHDASPTNTNFTMNDWQIWRSANLSDWSLAGTLLPEQTYYGAPSTQCWATDAARSGGKYYLYFSMGPEDIGVVESDTPFGPWRDPLGKPMIAKGQVNTASRDPGILQDVDGVNYIVFGTFDFYIARLNEDMISLAEAPRLIEINNKEGPFGLGKTDDKPFLHRRGNYYYLSWGTYYGMSKSPYGPFDCKGPLLLPENVDAPFLNDQAMRGPYAPPPQYQPRNWLNFDRHGSFFEWRDRWFFMCNDQSEPGTSPLFRRSVICEVNYAADGTLNPLSLSTAGVSIP
ncbi:family 43 glycosylhydrolase [Sphingobium rhizovicinum]|uniref:Family 43 glycosylhydrolase n=1 Tax=Sphingobium rhizovicinum TaxID=432308 RepID=A0ABV7NKN3_9SPHN